MTALKRNPLPGDVLAVGDRFRRIVGVIEDRVVYSVGRDTNRICKVTTLKRWARHAKLLHEPESAKYLEKCEAAIREAARQL